jgi:hypothetical protein
MACPVTVMTGDLAGYDQLRRTVLARFGRASWLIDVNHILRACLLTPADAGLLADLGPLADRLAAALESGDRPADGEPLYWFPATLALFEYRRGDDDRGLALAYRLGVSPPRSDLRDRERNPSTRVPVPSGPEGRPAPPRRPSGNRSFQSAA